MLEPRPPRPSAQSRPSIAPPAVTAPPPEAERRLAFRRATDQAAHEERVFLARALDALAADAPAEDRLAALLALLARTAGARRAAILADGAERRAAVAVAPNEDPSAGEALAAWLDATAERSRAERAAARPASVSVVTTSSGVGPLGIAARRSAGAAGSGAAGSITYARIAVPRSAGIVLGFEFDRAARAARLEARLPTGIARHAAVALAIVTAQLAAEREAATLRARDAERDRFMSTVAHELRTPLTGLRGYLELILAGRVDDPAVERDFLLRSRAIVGSMSELVGDLLELSKLESGTLELEIAPFSAAEAAGAVAAALLPIAIERDIRLVTDFPPRLRSATGDRRRVEQVLTNLAGNALKFTPAGGTVELVARFEGAVAVFVVRDDGRGIGAGDRDRIFEPFERLAGHDMVAGTGLGLPIARDLARRMAGELDVASVPDAGSAFVLVLPGPTPVADAAVTTALERALAGEEQRLEERAVLRVLAEPDGHTFVRSRREATNGAARSTREDGRPVASGSRSPVDG